MINSKKIFLDVSSIETLQRTYNLSESELSKRIGVSRPQLWRAKTGEAVGTAFIAGVLDAFKESQFQDVFNIKITCM